MQLFLFWILPSAEILQNKLLKCICYLTQPYSGMGIIHLPVFALCSSWKDRFYYERLILELYVCRRSDLISRFLRMYVYGRWEGAKSVFPQWIISKGEEWRPTRLSVFTEMGVVSHLCQNGFVVDKFRIMCSKSINLRHIANWNTTINVKGLSHSITVF